MRKTKVFVVLGVMCAVLLFGVVANGGTHQEAMHGRTFSILVNAAE